MEVSVKGEPHEIAALIFAVSERREAEKREPVYIDGKELFGRTRSNQSSTEESSQPA